MWVQAKVISPYMIASGWPWKIARRENSPNGKFCIMHLTTHFVWKGIWLPRVNMYGLMDSGEWKQIEGLGR